MKKLILVPLLLTVLIFGCEKFENPAAPPSGGNEVNFTLTSPSGGSLNDSLAAGQLGLLSAITNLQNIISYTWTFGDGTTDTGRVVSKKYNSTGAYNICLTVQTTGQTYNYCRVIYVYSPGVGASKPLFIGLPGTQIGNEWYVGYANLKEAVEIVCTPTAPFIVFSEVAGWFPLNLVRDTIINGHSYYVYWELVSNNQIRKFAYGGNFPANCYAWMAPNPPHWSSAYWVQAESKLCVKWVNGIAHTISGDPTNLPGMTGDVGASPVARFDISLNGDTVKIFLNKDRLTTPHTSVFQVNSITGLNSPQTLNNNSTAPGFPDWWLVRIHKNSLPTSGIVQIKYGRNWGSNVVWATIQHSVAYNQSQGVLEVRVLELGGRGVSITAYKAF
ncbi:MAG: PKD domain-containing protein [Patescibacteria group bacterium]|nr:MAG: PKD domain-containing protein [Patescibacteria group bacterium]